MAVSNNVGDNVSVNLNDGGWSFTDPRFFGTGDGNWTLAIADLDGDGDPDIVTADYLNDTVTVLLNECLVIDNCPADIDGNNNVDVGDLVAIIVRLGRRSR